MMLTGINSALTGIKGAMQIVKGLQSIKESFDGATLKAQIVELMEALSDARLALIEAKESAITQDQEINRLKDALSKKKEMVERDGYFYMKRSDNGEPKGSPYCSTCLQVNGHQILTTKIPMGGHLKGSMCPTCKSNYLGIKSYPNEHNR